MGHMSGLVVPLTYLTFLQHGDALGLPRSDERPRAWSTFAWSITGIIWIVDLFRLSFPSVAARFPDAGLLRRHERTQLTGTCWFSLGASLTTAAFTPALATTALVMLTLGDMAAALVGVAIGGETVV